MLLVLLADLRALAAVDRRRRSVHLRRRRIGISLRWNVLLAAREGLGGVVTTMAIRHEPKVKALLGVPDELAVAAVIALGHPVRTPKRLKRADVADFTTLDRFTGPRFPDA